MKKLMVILVIGAVAFFARQRGQQQDFVSTDRDGPEARQPEAMSVEMDTTKFHCDGRIYCSQMTSCAEATFFLQNCPGVKMDGDNGGRGDGVPCEKQWCGNR